MSEIPERYALDWRTLAEPPVPSETWEWDKQRHEAMGDFARKLLPELGRAEAELAAAKARIRFLEQERKLDEHSMVNGAWAIQDLQTQLAAVTQDRDGLLHDKAFPVLENLARLQARNKKLEDALRDISNFTPKDSLSFTLNRVRYIAAKALQDTE